MDTEYDIKEFYWYNLLCVGNIIHNKLVNVSQLRHAVYNIMFYRRIQFDFFFFWDLGGVNTVRHASSNISLSPV